MEELRVCAFIDSLGTSDTFLGGDKEKREGLVNLLRKLSQRQTTYSANAQSLGGGVNMQPTCQVTTFSDSLASSFPAKQLMVPGTVGNEPYHFPVLTHKFFEDMLWQAIHMVWDAMKLGVLVRGGISSGLLVHDREVIAGEALVKAVDLEKKGPPRIIIDPALFELKDDKDKLIIEKSVRDCFNEKHGQWYIDTLNFHILYWHFCYENGKLNEELIHSELEVRSKMLAEEYQKVKASKNQKVLGYWEEFLSDLDNAFTSGYWNTLPNAKNTMFKHLQQHL